MQNVPYVLCVCVFPTVLSVFVCVLYFVMMLLNLAGHICFVCNIFFQYFFPIFLPSSFHICFPSSAVVS